MPDVPSNLIPTSILGLPTAPVASEDSIMMVCYQGGTYQIRVGDLLNVAGVPTTRNVLPGTGLTGGGELSADVTLSVAPKGVNSSLITDTGVTAGVYGNTTNIPVLTIDSTGRVTAATTVALTVSGYVPMSRTVSAGDGLTGGGALNNDVALSADLSDSIPLAGDNTGSAGSSSEISRTDHKHPSVNLSSGAEVKNILGLSNGGTAKSLVANAGAIIWCGADGLYVGPVGESGQVLVSNGANEYGWGSALLVLNQPANYIYAGPASGPDAPTAFRAIVNADLPNSGVTANTYGSATKIPVVTVNAKGVVTGVSEETITHNSLDTIQGGTTDEYYHLTSAQYAVSTQAATASADGYLTSTDWSTFNGKQSSGLCVLKAGDTMSGMLTLATTSASLVPLHFPQGSATPSAPTDGDVWFDQNGMYIQNLSAIHQLDADANAVGALSKVVITDNGNGTVNASSIEVFIYAASGWQGNYMRRTVPAATSLVLAAGANYLTVIYNGGSPIFQITQNATSVNNSNVLLIANMWLDGTQIHYTVVNWGLATATRLNDRLINVQRYVRTSGLTLSETATPVARTITASSGLVWYGVTAVSELSVDSSSSNCDFYYHVTGVWTKSSVSTYNNSQYDNGTNLVTLSGVGTQYAVNWVYRYIVGSSLPKLAYVLGSGNYSLAQAQASTAPTPPSILTAQAILIGRIIVAQNASTATQIDSAFTTVFAGSTVTDHNNLAGLQGGTTDEYYHLTSAQYTVSTQAATTSTNGYLTSTDWSTFNNKQPAGSYVTLNGALGTPSSGTLTNCTFPTLNQDTTGKSAKTDALNSATTVVNVSSATAPTTGQVLTATSSTAATWQNPTGGVTSVTGSGNIASSGGSTPNITFTGTLPIANGGTGTTHGIDGGVF